MNYNIRQQNIINAKDKNILCLACAAGGKAIPMDTVLPTPNGPKKAGDVRVGDFLFDRNGKPTKIIGVYPQGEKEIYEITFGDKRKAKCCKEHLWYVNKTTWKDKNKFEAFSTAELLQEKLINTNRRANFYIPVASAVKYETKKYNLSPYIIGAMLGDGCCMSNDTMTISSESEEIPSYILKLIGGGSLYKNPANFNWQFFNKKGEGIKTDILPIELRQYSYNKSIPNEYKYGDIEQRLELIRGLMDTDGSIFKDNRIDHAPAANIRFTSTSFNLIKDVQEVLWSLGYGSTISQDKRVDKYTNKKCYSLLINIPNSEKYKLFSLKRKKDIALQVKDLSQKKNFDRTSIRKIEKLNTKTEMVCFEVDNAEHLYLMNDFIVTHNTSTLIGRINKLLDDGVSPKKIVCFSFTNQAAEEMRKRLGEKAAEMFIGTIHSYANKICGIGGIETYGDIAEEQFDKIISKALKVAAGLYPEVDHLFVDEFQDTDPLQYNFICRIPAKNRFYVGDERQFIYSFRGASDQFIRELATDDNFKKYYLVENYRNPPNIIRFADDFLNSMPKISPSAVPTITKSGFLDTECTFTDAAEEMTWTTEWTGWAVLCRTNSELEEAEKYLNSIKIPNVIVKRGDLDLAAMGHLLEQNKVKIMTIHSAKGLEFPYVVTIGAKTFNQEERRICYVAATRAMKSLYWCPTIRTYRGKAKGKSHKAGNVFSKTSQKSIIF